MTPGKPSVILRPDGSPARAEHRQPRARASATSWGNVYEAANRADFRGYFWIPSLKPSDMQPAYTRRAIQERIDYLYKNVGALGMVIDGLAGEEVGTGLWPKWESESDAYNQRMTDLFHYTGHDPRFFSADGKEDYYTRQVTIRRLIRLQGDCFQQMLRPAPGSTIPLCHGLPSWRIEGEKPNADGTPGVRDGVREDRMGRALSYQPTRDGEAAEPPEVAAADMLHQFDPMLPGQRRGVSVLASVARSLYRREDILKAIKNGTLARERMGFAIQTKDDEGGAPEIPGEGDATTVENPDGSKFTIKQIFGDGEDERLVIPDLPNGAEIKLIESNRPTEPVTNFLDSILREVAWACKRPPEYVFFIAGMGQGTVARMVHIRNAAEIQQTRANQLVPQFCNRWHVFFAWQMILAGKMDGLIGGIPGDWWRHTIHSDGDKSVDIGREGRMYDSREATGQMATDDYHALGGKDAGDVDRRNLARKQKRLDALAEFNKSNAGKPGFIPWGYFDMWPRTAQQQLSQDPAALAEEIAKQAAGASE